MPESSYPSVHRVITLFKSQNKRIDGTVKRITLVKFLSQTGFEFKTPKREVFTRKVGVDINTIEKKADEPVLNKDRVKSLLEVL